MCKPLSDIETIIVIDICYSLECQRNLYMRDSDLYKNNSYIPTAF